MSAISRYAQKATFGWCASLILITVLSLAQNEPEPTPFSARLATWRRAFTPEVELDDAVPPSSRSQIRLRTSALDTSVSSQYGTRMTVDTRPVALTVKHEKSVRGTLPYIVQFTGPVLAGWKQSVAAAGGILRGYIPNNAFLVEMPEKAVQAVGMIPAVQWIGEYRPEYKVQPFLAYVRSLVQEEIGDLEEAPSIRVTVQTLAPEYCDEVADWIHQVGGEILAVKQAKRMGLIEAGVGLDMIEALSQRASVRWIEEYVAPTLHNDFAVLGHHMNVTNVEMR